jgi:hypothetical protein
VLGWLVLSAVSGWGRAAGLQDPVPPVFTPLAEALQYVDGEGLVDYSALKRNRQVLDRFGNALETFPNKDYNSFEAEEKIAFWVNAYNGLTLLAIIDHYPIQSSFLTSLIYPRNSIRQISGVWDELTFRVMGSQMTLDHIEHHILRRDFDEPRIHLALVCAAMSCPPLRNEPYVATRLDAQLQDQARRFLANPSKFRIERTSGTVHLSRIFEWFGSDFVSRYGNSRQFSGFSVGERAVLNFISSLLSEEDGEYLRSGDYELEYLDYDWTLNERGEK